MRRLNLCVAALNLGLLALALWLAWDRLFPQAPPAVEIWLDAASPGAG